MHNEVGRSQRFPRVARMVKVRCLLRGEAVRTTVSAFHVLEMIPTGIGWANWHF